MSWRPLLIIGLLLIPLAIVATWRRSEDAARVHEMWRVDLKSTVSVCEVHDGQLALGCVNGNIILYDVATKESRLIGKHREEITCIRFIDAQTLVSAGFDNVVGVWNLARGRKIKSVIQSTVPRALAVSPDGTVLAVGLGEFPNGEIRLFNAVTFDQISLIDQFSSVVSRLVFLDNDRLLLYAARQTEELDISKKLRREVEDAPLDVTHFAISNNAQLVTIAGFDSTRTGRQSPRVLLLYSPLKRKRVGEIVLDRPHHIQDACFVGDDSVLVCGSISRDDIDFLIHDGIVKVVDLVSNESKVLRCDAGISFCRSLDGLQKVALISGSRVAFVDLTR